MPIYEYQCSACGQKSEKLQKISDALLKDCPACNEPALNKLMSAAAFRLKGGGWYETDFKTGDKKNVSGEAAASGGDDTGGSGPADGASTNGSSGKSDGASDTSTKSDSSAGDKASISGNTTGGATPTSAASAVP